MLPRVVLESVRAGGRCRSGINTAQAWLCRRAFFGIPSSEVDAASDRVAKRHTDSAASQENSGAEGDAGPLPSPDESTHAALAARSTVFQYKSFQEYLAARPEPQEAHSSAKTTRGYDASAAKPNVGQRLQGVLDFDLKPKEVKEYLDRFVIGQDEAKKVLCVALCDHYNRCRAHLRRKLETTDAEEPSNGLIKPNVLLCGPSGSGKTHLVRTLARKIGVPFVKADATKFSATGYVGRDVEEIVQQLVAVAQGDVDAAGYGIVYVDEVDKICSPPASLGGLTMGSGSGVNNKDVQTSLLKLMEDGEIVVTSSAPAVRGLPFPSTPPGASGSKMISTRHVLFIFSGAFTRLPEMLAQKQTQRRLQSEAEDAGTSDEPDEQSPPDEKGSGGQQDADILQRASTEDFVEYGFEYEFIGRIPVRVGLRHLSVDDLLNILQTSEDSVLRQAKEDFRGYGIDVSFERAALEVIARKSHGEGTGARGLVTVLEKVLRELKFELPSTSIRTVVVDPFLVENPEAGLRRLLEDAS